MFLQKNLIYKLYSRKLIKEIFKKNILIKKLNNNYINLYCGFDPTANSLHIGHLIIINLLKYFQLYGNKLFILIGGGTALIGDPSFKKKKRKLNNKKKIKIWINKIKKQIKFLFNNKKNNIIILNNYKWFNKINLLFFLKNIGNFFFIKKMIKKEMIKNQIDINNNNNISFAEFSYILLQSFDFTILNKIYNIKLQIGGNDQLINILYGIYLTKNLNKFNVFGLTLPIITQSNGIKFGKSEKNTIWLNSKKTSIYNFYQFWINIKDIYIYKYLKYFTLLNNIYIKILKKINKKINKKPYSKYILAEEITRIIHGSKKLKIIKKITKNLFENKIFNLNKYDFYQLKISGFPIINIKYIFNKINLTKILVITKLSKSFNQAKKIIQTNSISINGKKCCLNNYFFKKTDILYNHYTLLKKGKKLFFLIYWY